MNDRENMIERMVEQYRVDLEEKDDDELLGGKVDELREHTIWRMTQRYQRELEEQVKSKIEHYQDESWRSNLMKTCSALRWSLCVKTPLKTWLSNTSRKWRGS